MYPRNPRGSHLRRSLALWLRTQPVLYLCCSRDFFFHRPPDCKRGLQNPHVSSNCLSSSKYIVEPSQERRGSYCPRLLFGTDQELDRSSMNVMQPGFQESCEKGQQEMGADSHITATLRRSDGLKKERHVCSMTEQHPAPHPTHSLVQIYICWDQKSHSNKVHTSGLC